MCCGNTCWGAKDGRAEQGRRQTPEEVKLGTNETYICIIIFFFFVFLETFSETWSLTESGFFASDPSLTLNANQWFAVVGILLSNSVASTSTFANDTPDSVQPCSPQNISLLAKAAQ